MTFLNIRFPTDVRYGFTVGQEALLHAVIYNLIGYVRFERLPVITL